MVTSAHAAPRPDDTTGFRQYWLAETIRLRESQWGPLQDNNETRRARALGDDFSQRLLLRATYLGRREGMVDSIQRWLSGAKLAFVVLLVVALLTGAAAAAGALGDGTRQVNIILALTALLGLHILTFIFWCVGSVIPYSGSHTALGDLWLWLTRKIARGPQAGLIPRALLSMLSRHGALRPLLGAITHTVWSLALLAMLALLLALLSARRYTFSWETTLLSPDTFVRVTQGLGWLPSKLGFSIPPETIIRASDGLQTVPDYAHALWSSWLIGCVVCYGILPRLLALLVTVTTTLARAKTIELDTRLPGYAELRDRLDPPSLPAGIDAPAPAAPRDASRPQSPSTSFAQHAIVGIELASDEAWPPAPLAPHIADLGVVDDRKQRQLLLDSLYAKTPTRLLIVCDGRQTPDRGVIALVQELSSLAEQARVLVWTGPQPNTSEPSAPPAGARGKGGLGPDLVSRRSVWTHHILRAGLSAEDVYIDPAPAIEWLDTVSAGPSQVSAP